MDTPEQKASWIERIEALINMLEGSTISELELAEAGIEIIIRRNPGMRLVALPTQQVHVGQVGVALAPGQYLNSYYLSPGHGEGEGAQGSPLASKQAVAGVAIVAPLTGVYYSSPSPASPVFVSLGDVVQVGQVVALVEAMKVFNEIQSEVSGRVTALVATNGEVVQKGDVLLRIEPM